MKILKKQTLKVIATIVFVQLLFLMCIPFEKCYAEETNYSSSKNNYIEKQTTIEFDKFQTNKIEIESHLPSYSLLDSSLYPNNCANIAGANIIGYWDRYFKNLMPNYNSGIQIGKNYRYFKGGKDITELCKSMYLEMKTNKYGTGTTYNNFVNGIKNYTQKQGYNIKFTKCSINKQLNLNNANNIFLAKKPVLMFVNKFGYLDPSEGIVSNGSKDTITERIYNKGHVLCVSGYYEYQYYKNGKNIRTDKYLATSDGWGNYALVPIDENLNIVHSDIVEVY